MNHPTTGHCVMATCTAAQEEKLRHEIVESQKSLADLAKWKLIAVAAVASVSFPGKDALPGGGNGAALLICLVPLICAYVDLSSIHIILRIVLIGIYLKHCDNPYELYVFELRDRSSANPFRFETGALYGSSIAMNLLILLAGALLLYFPVTNWSYAAWGYIVASVVGLATTTMLLHMHMLRYREVLRVAEVILVNAKKGGPEK
jgi:hypothetical protein